jgi:hypothetical protein
VTKNSYCCKGSASRWYHKQLVFRKEVKNQEEEDDDLSKATGSVDDGFAFTR